MFESLFPNWSNPAAIAGFVALRFALHCGLVAVVARAVGVRSLPTAAAALLTVGSVAIMVSTLSPGGLGHAATYVEHGATIALLLLAGGALVAGDRSLPVAGGGVILLALALLAGLYTIPLYGEAFVAP